jgi:hypothetical protein
MHQVSLSLPKLCSFFSKQPCLPLLKRERSSRLHVVNQRFQNGNRIDGFVHQASKNAFPMAASLQVALAATLIAMHRHAFPIVFYEDCLLSETKQEHLT